MSDRPAKVNFLALDLEMEQPSNRIIMLGICIGNLSTGEILHRQDWLINTDEPISAFISSLTGITDAQRVARGVSLAQAFKELSELHKRFDCFINPITWGHGDTELLRQQVRPNLEDWPFGFRQIDVKTIWQFWRMSRGLPTQGGLAKSMTKIGLNFEGKKHNANDDAFNTFRVAHLLFKKIESMT